MKTTNDAPEWQGQDKSNYWFDSIPSQTREHWVDGARVEHFPAKMILSEERNPRLPKYMTAPFGTYVSAPPIERSGEYPLAPDVSGLPLTVSVNKVTVTTTPTPQPQEPPEMSTLQLNPLPAGVGDSQAAAPAAEHPVLALVSKLVEAKAPLDQATKVYLQIRDKKKDLDQQAKEKTGPLATALEQLENYFLAKFAELGVDNVKTEHGTPYVSTRTNASVADADQYTRFVLTQAFNGLSLPEAMQAKLIGAILDSGALAFLEMRAAKGPVEAYVAEHQAPPPGVNWSSTRVVNVRK